MQIYGKTDIGCVRSSNQDAIYYTTDPVGNLPNLAIVADGMGGHNAGEIASSFTIEEVCRLARADDSRNPITIMKQGLYEVNRLLREKAKEKEEYSGMGTTFVGAVVRDGQLYIANVGDSRLYLIGNGIRQVTVDHSLVQELVRDGKLDPSNARNHPDKNIITRAVGAEQILVPDFYQVEITEKALLCSDGLSNMLDDDEIFDIVQSCPAEQAVEKLIREARFYGGKDNISAILIDAKEADVC